MISPGTPKNERSDTIAVFALDVDGVLTDGLVAYNAQGEEQKTLSLRDIDAVFNIRLQGVELVLVTGEDNPWVEFVAQRLEVQHLRKGAKDKLLAVESLSQELGVPLSRFCYVGDSDRDAPALAAVGLALAPADATLQAKAAAKVTLAAAGGHGCVYEAVELILSAPDSPASVPSEGTIPNAGRTNAVEELQRMVSESIAVQRAVGDELAPQIAEAAALIGSAIKGGHKLLIFGNGGSAADAQHFAAEFVGRFLLERSPYAAIALTTDTSALTALANDYGMESMFRRQLEALARPGDIALALSTSGNSENVLAAVEAAKKIPIHTIGMTGRSGGRLARAVDLCLSVPSDSTPRIQEAHGLMIHAISELVETGLTAESTE